MPHNNADDDIKMTAPISNSQRPLRIIRRTLIFLISSYFFFLHLKSTSKNALFGVLSNQPVPKDTTTQNDYDYIDEFLELTKPKATSTLVHYDPHFMGGFRNQHMRFVAFVNKAAEHNISQILLPSLRWGDVSQPGKSAPHELLFDVVYWNKRAGEFGLPRLVRYDANVLERNSGGEGVIPCFNETSSLYSGLDEKQWRSSKIVLRKHAIWEYLGEPATYAHCKITFDAMSDNTSNGPMTYLVPHGGTKGGGRLWWEYDGMQAHRRKRDEVTGKYPDHLPLEQAIYKLLVPSPPIQQAITKSLKEAAGQSSIQPYVLALHPRIEHDMILHRVCSKFMESNLTKIFESISTLPKFDLMFVAVSRALVDGTPPPQMKRVPDLLRLANENKFLLNQTSTYGLLGTKDRRGIPMLESGTTTAAKIQFPPMKHGAEFLTAKSMGVTELVASIVNFFTALEANLFVGVKGSTYSQDIISVRYYQHQDRGIDVENNFVVGPNGLTKLSGPSERLPCA